MKLTILNTVANRLFRYLLKRYIGNFLENLSLDQLSWSIFNGEGSVENVRLNNEALNELSNEYNLPFEFLHASIDRFSMSLPFKAMLSENTVFELKGIKLIVQPKERLEDVSMFDSMWGSMTSSLQLAEECLNSKSEDDEKFLGSDKTSKGLEETAKIIDTVLANTKVIFQDISMKIEHMPGNGPSGVALEIKIETAEYFDEAGKSAHSDKSSENSTYEPQAHSFKKIIFEGISLFTAQFSAESRTFPTKLSSTVNRMEPSGFIPGSPEMPPTHSSLPVKRIEPELNDVPVLISKLTGRQELRLKLKQNEAIIGPKLEVEFNLGDLNLFLIPQQVHMLHELFSGLMKPCSKHENIGKTQFGVTNKPMRPADYALVEQELLRQQQKSHVPSRSLKNQQGWSSHSLDESDDEFQLMGIENKAGSDFQTSSNNDSLCSSLSTDTQSDITGNLLGNSRRSSKSRGSSVQAMLQDQLSELTHFYGSLSSLCIIILHDDSVRESLSRDACDITKSNSNTLFSLKERTEIFFNDLLALQMSGQDSNSFASSRKILSELCNTNHLRIMATSISIDANEKASNAQCIMNFSISFFQFEVLECLFKTANCSTKLQTPTYVEVLSCDNQIHLDENNTSLKEACFKLTYQQIEYTTQSRHIKPPANKLNIQFGLLNCELDISLTDRIQTLLDFQKFYGQMDTKIDDWKNPDVSRYSPKTEIMISSPRLVLNLRFPIPDLRSVHDMDRVPWWQQNIHPEILIMEAKDITFNTSLDGDVSQAKYEIQCRDLHGLFKQPDVDLPISFLRVSVDPDIDEVSQNNGFDWPRLVIKRTMKSPGGDLEAGLEEHEELFSLSLTEALMSNLDAEPNPFQSTSVAYGSKLSSQNRSAEKDKTNKSIDHDEVIKPANKESMNTFIEQTVSKSEVLLEFFLPTANVVLPSKEFFEVFYNRLGSDLLLWEPTTLAPKASYDTSGFKVHIPGLDFNPHLTSNAAYGKFPEFKPFFNDSNSDSEEEEANFCSVYEYCQKDRQKHKKADRNNLFTKLSITVSITKGSLAFHTHALDNANNMLPEVCGKLQLCVEDGLIFLASSYRGDPNESYLCVLADKSTLYHNATTTKPKEFPVVETLRGGQPQGLNCIIYESEPGTSLKSVRGESFKDMLKIAVHIVRQPKQLLKSFKVAIDIADATLRHYMHISNQMWINQMIDFLKLQDFPVNGYTPSDVITEFHLNLSNCAIDYRPLKIQSLSVITVENFNMSCNIAATTPSFIFRIISEEMRFFISNNIATKKVDLKKNYVCVIDSGLIDITYRTSYNEKNEAKQELCITNNIIHIRTCADSFKALLDLLIYFSSNGDMDPADFEEPQQDTKECKKDPPKNSDSENVHRMMAEAMRDFSKISVSEGSCVQSGSLTGNDTTTNIDDEFCILEDDPGIGLMPRNGEPEIRMLTESPIVIVENHFSVSSGKADVFKAPKHFPKPIYMLQLREMSLVWHLYGGNDFKPEKKKGPRNKENDGGVTFSDEKNVNIGANNSVISFCKVTPAPKNFNNEGVKYTMEHVILDHEEKSRSDSWLSKGGPHRNHDILMELQMNKIKFQRDVYPLNNEYSSRYVLLINDIEILDRLKSSDINKFLYQYSSQKLPRQTHANMVEVKAIYTRADPNCISEECSLNVSCKPLRLNIDQDSFIFLVGFFNEVMSIPSEEKAQGDGSVMNEANSHVTSIPQRKPSSSSVETFYKSFTFHPDLLIKIDYQGKHFLMEQGTIKGILMGLGKLNDSEIKLKHLSYRHGLLGLHKVLAYAINEWQQDILKSQLPSILGGVGPMRSFVLLFNGVKDFFWLPVEQYQKDGQIVRGLQRGTSSLTISALIATLDIFEEFVGAIRSIAMLGHDIVSTGPSVANRYQLTQEAYRVSSQPADFREGLTSALNVFKDGFGDTARTIYSAAYAEHEHKGVAGAVGGVIRQLPQAAIAPVVISCQATRQLIETMKHQVMPDAHIEGIHKWKTKNS